MSIFEDSNTLMFVGNVTNGYADNDLWVPETQPAGSVAIVKVSDNRVEEGALVAGTEYRVIAKTLEGALHFSPIFTSATIKNIAGSTAAARTEQVTYLGYNGTAGSMDMANNTYYGLGIVLNHTFGMLNNSPLLLTIPYRSGAAATQAEVALGLALEAGNVIKRQAYKPFKVERVYSGATGNALGTATANVINGSNRVIFNEDMTLLVTAGTILRLGGIGVGTAPCYIVTSVDAGAGAARIYYLDQPYQGATNATLAANQVESAAAGGNWGLKFTGISVPDNQFNPVTDEPFVASFELVTRDFTTAVATYTTAPNVGNGTYQLVSAMEAYAQFQRRTKELSAYPPTKRVITALTGSNYRLFSFEMWDDKFVDATTGVNPKSLSRIIIAVESTLANENINTVLGVA